MIDDPVLVALILIAAGAAMGFVNNLAGAGGVIGLAAFDWVVGLNTAAANASLRPAALAIAISGALGFLSKRERIPKRAWGYALCALPGAILGALLAVTVADWVYQASLLAVLIVLTIKMVRGSGASAGHRPWPAWLTAVAFGIAGLHMGFIQVGVGLVTMAALTHTHSRDLVQVNTAKMAIIGVAAATSTTTLAVQGAIQWGPAGWLALGAGLGSFSAGRWSVKQGHEGIRMAVLVICGLVLVRQAFQLVG